MEEVYDDYIDHEESGSRKVGLFVGLGIVIVVAIALAFIIRAARPPIIPAPTSYISYSAPDGAFKVDQPVGWSSTDSGAGAVTSGAKFRAGRAKIIVNSDLGGSLMGDMAQAQNNQYESIGQQAGVNLPPPTPVIEKVHMAGKQDEADVYKNYNEMPMQPFTAKMGEGRVSEFTADGGPFTGKLHGYRATLLSNERRITIIEACTEKNWPILQPAFKHVMESVELGQTR